MQFNSIFRSPRRACRSLWQIWTSVENGDYLWEDPFRMERGFGHREGRQADERGRGGECSHSAGSWFEMKISKIRAKNFRRFTNLQISDIPETSRLIILAGPN